jgi:NAD(P)-dependent dehydrogenase (short-subunit alcohol dehydrogenase family)
MADSFAYRPGARPRPPRHRRRVLVTGASGNIGSYFAEHCHERYDLRLMFQPGDDRPEMGRFGQLVWADLGDRAALAEACRGMDTVLHLAAAAGPETPWETLLEANIVGTYNVFVAAKAADCRRVIYASSIHAISGYPPGRQVQADDPVNPGDLYGVSKCFGEAMARYMAQQQGLSSIVLRIGAFQPLEAARQPESIPMLDAFVSPRDLAHLIELCIDDDTLQFAILQALSDNAFNRMDITEAKELLGYAPVDDFTREHPDLRHLEIAEKLQTHSEQGGQEPGIREELEELEQRR